MPPPFDAIFFDIGSTLIPSADIIAHAARHACAQLERNSLIPDAQIFFAGYQQADAQVHPPHISHIYSDARIIARAEELARLPFDNRRLGFFLHAYREAMRARIQPAQEFLELFEALARAGVLRGIVSDGSLEGQSEVLFRLGLLPYISPNLCLISEAQGVEKSHPEIYRRALALAQVAPNRALMIGDHLERDVAVPQSVGMKAVLLRAHPPPQFIAKELSATARVLRPDFQFDNWSDLNAWLVNQ